MRIAFLGLGNMGGGMAGRLLAAGHSLAVFNRTATRAAPFEKLGARIADSPRSAALQPSTKYAPIASANPSKKAMTISCC